MSLQNHILHEKEKAIIQDAIIKFICIRCVLQGEVEPIRD